MGSSALRRSFECRDLLTDSHSFYGRKLRSQIDMATLTQRHCQKQFARSMKSAINCSIGAFGINCKSEKPAFR